MDITDQLLSYTLHLADNALILGHRNSEWTGHGPILEQDIALSNISLDLIGQARNLYQYAASVSGDQKTEDDFAYLRDSRDFLNCQLVEQPNGDWGKTIVRQFFFSTYQYQLYQQVSTSSDSNISAIAKKSIKETAYHLRWSSEWMIRLGDGTAESKRRIQGSVDDLWMYLGELYSPVNYETTLVTSGVIDDPALLREPMMQRISTIMEEATLVLPVDTFMQTGGKTGVHTEHLGYLLAEMQVLQRSYPGATW